MSLVPIPQVAVLLNSDDKDTGRHGDDQLGVKRRNKDFWGSEEIGKGLSEQLRSLETAFRADNPNGD